MRNRSSTKAIIYAIKYIIIKVEPGYPSPGPHTELVLQRLIASSLGALYNLQGIQLDLWRLPDPSKRSCAKGVRDCLSGMSSLHHKNPLMSLSMVSAGQNQARHPAQTRLQHNWKTLTSPEKKLKEATLGRQRAHARAGTSEMNRVAVNDPSNGLQWAFYLTLSGLWDSLSPSPTGKEPYIAFDYPNSVMSSLNIITTVQLSSAEQISTTKGKGELDVVRRRKKPYDTTPPNSKTKDELITQAIADGLFTNKGEAEKIIRQCCHEDRQSQPESQSRRASSRLELQDLHEDQGYNVDNWEPSATNYLENVIAELSTQSDSVEIAIPTKAKRKYNGDSEERSPAKKAKVDETAWRQQGRSGRSLERPSYLL
ncbi:hypothetical protein LZL87_003340 [Fusarium oxysporum]|nr:hypothetical protein LZL87_003340 [Fusarium oxysporum]